MTTYFVGSMLDAFIASPTGCSDGDGVTHVNGGYADAIATDPATGSPIGVGRLWTHGDLSTNNYGPPTGIIPYQWFNSDGVAVMRLISTDGWAFGLQFWNGTDWHQPGDSVGTNSGTFDFFVNVHASAGRLAWYHNGTLCSDVAGLDTSAMGNVAKLRLGMFQNYVGSTNHASVILASYGTLGHTVTRRGPTGNGAHGDWTGSYADIDDDGSDDSDAISTGTADTLATFTTSAMSAPTTGNVIKCVAVAARMRSDGGDAPTHAQAVLRIDGTDHVAPFGMAMASGFAGAVTCFDLDPATSAPWASIDHANSEFGVKAAA